MNMATELIAKKKWGIVGALAGAIVLPLLSTLLQYTWHLFELIF